MKAWRCEIEIRGGPARRCSAPEVSAATFVEAHYHWLCMTKHLHTLVTHAADV